jgi:preprotein translocase subunit SecF
MQKFFEIIPSGTNIPFVAQRRRYIVVSIVVILLAFAAMAFNYATRGSVLNFGIDFQGGSQVRLAFVEPVDVGRVREALDGFGYDGGSAVAVPDAENEVLIRVKEIVSIDRATAEACREALGRLPDAQLTEQGFVHPEGGSKIFLAFDGQPKYADIEVLMNGAGCEGKAEAGVGEAGSFKVDYTLIGVGAKLQEQLEQVFGPDSVESIVSSETVGAKVGNQLKIDGALSMLYAIGFIFLYVMVRFDLRFAPGGIVALIHDAIIVVGAFAITWKEFNLQTIAALLTIIGYSINDTIVVFDRVRERVALDRDVPIEEATNHALNETLSRTVLTSGTTLLVVVATWGLGSGPIRDFAFALFVGIVVGTYSSLFVASPVFLWVNRRFYGGRGHLRGSAEASEGTGTLLGSPSPEQVGEDGVTEAGRRRALTSGDAEQDREAPTGGDDEKRVSRRRRRRPGAGS